MSLRKLKGIRKVGAYTAEKGIVEKLLWIEEEVKRNESVWEIINEYEVKDRIEITLPELRKKTREITQQHFREKNIHTIMHEDFKQYLHITIEKRMGWKEGYIKGVYTSEIFNHLAGDQPFEIDLENKPCDWLFYGLNNERPISIRNLRGNDNFAHVGSCNGKAIVDIRNLQGDWNFAGSGTDHGSIIANAQNITGEYNFHLAGLHLGNVTVTAQNVRGSWNFSDIGTTQRNSTLIAKEIYGKNAMLGFRGTLILHNAQPLETRVEGVTDGEKEHILNLLSLIDQNTSPEDIMDYLRRST